MTGPTRRDLRPLVRERVERAKTILGAASIESSIEGAVWWIVIDQYRSDKRRSELLAPKNKQEKAAIDRVAKALRRLRHTLQIEHLPKFVKDRFDEGNLNTISAWLDIMGRTSLKHRWGKSTAPPHLQRRAVQLAADLLYEHKIRLVTTRGGKFHRLAAALYGDEIDLFNFLRPEMDRKFDPL